MPGGVRWLCCLVLALCLSVIDAKSVKAVGGNSTAEEEVTLTSRRLVTLALQGATKLLGHAGSESLSSVLGKKRSSAFLDDESGSTANDPVPMPADVNTSQPQAPRFIDIAHLLECTLSEGGRPATAGTRVVAHCCLAWDTALRLHLEVASKVACGDALVVLGLRVDIAADRLDFRDAKQSDRHKMTTSE